MPIAWKDEFYIDGGVIDKDHRFLIDCINRLIDGVQTANYYNFLREEFANLRAFAAKHFVREEALMKASGYPRYAEHRREHEDALIQLDRFVELLTNAHYGAMNAENLRGKMHNFLYRWLLSHIMYNDVKMRPYVQNMREAAKSLVPLRAA